MFVWDIKVLLCEMAELCIFVQIFASLQTIDDKSRYQSGSCMVLAPHDVHLCYELQTGNIKQCTRQSCSCTGHYCHTANTRLDSTARGRLAFNAANLHVKRGPVPTLCCQRGNKQKFGMNC